MRAASCSKPVVGGGLTHKTPTIQASPQPKWRHLLFIIAALAAPDAQVKADSIGAFAFTRCGCCSSKPHRVLGQVASSGTLEAQGYIQDWCARPAVLSPTLDAILIRPPFQGAPFNRTPCPHFFLRLRLARCAYVQSQNRFPAPQRRRRAVSSKACGRCRWCAAVACGSGGREGLLEMIYGWLGVESPKGEICDYQPCTASVCVQMSMLSFVCVPFMYVQCWVPIGPAKNALGHPHASLGPTSRGVVPNVDPIHEWWKAKSVEIGAPFSAAAAARILSQRPKVPLDWYGPCAAPAAAAEDASSSDDPESGIGWHEARQAEQHGGIN